MTATLVAGTLAVTPAAARADAPVTVLDFEEPGQHAVFTPTDSTMSVTPGVTDIVRFVAQRGVSPTVMDSVMIGPPTGQQLTAGTTYAAAGTADAGHALLEADGANGCNTDQYHGSFTVLDLARGGNGVITSIAVSYHQTGCSEVAGELRWNSTVGFRATVTQTEDSLQFPPVPMGRTSLPKAFTVTSRGTLPVTMGTASIVGADAASFGITANTCDGATLAAGQSCTVALVAHPTRPNDLPSAPLTATLSLTDNHAGVSYAPTMTAHGTTTQVGDFYPLPPYRLLDTRQSGSIGPGGLLPLKLSGNGPAHGQLPPFGASAVVLNVTVTNATAPSFLTLWPGGSLRPDSSNINFTPGWTGANSVTVPLDNWYQVDIFNNAGTVDVAVDITGYYAGIDDDTASPAGQGGQYDPHAPVRAADTRTAGTGQVPTGHWLDVPFDYGTSVNPHVKAVAVNLTAVNPHGPGFLTAWNGAGTAPSSSVLNYTAGAIVPNMAVIQTSTCTFPSCAGLPQIGVLNTGAAGVDIVVDVFGYFDDGGLNNGGIRYHPVPPTRIVDSRTGLGIPQAMTTNSTATATAPATVAGPYTRALALNLTGVSPTGPTFLSVWPAGLARPSASTLNLNTGDIRANATITGLSADRKFNVYNQNGTVNVVADVSGSFDVIYAGEPTTPAAGPTPHAVTVH